MALNLGYGTNLFNPYGNTRNYVDPDEEEDFAWENINYNPNALTRLEQLGIMNPDILPENRPYESYESIFDDRNLMADLSQVLTTVCPNRPDVEFSYGERSNANYRKSFKSRYRVLEGNRYYMK